MRPSGSFTIERIVPMIDEAHLDCVVIVPQIPEGDLVDYGQEGPYPHHRPDLRLTILRRRAA